MKKVTFKIPDISTDMKIDDVSDDDDVKSNIVVQKQVFTPIITTKNYAMKIDDVSDDNDVKSNIVVQKQVFTPIRTKKNYTMKKAFNVAIRMHNEIENPTKFRKRFYKEKIAEKLLISHNLCIQANKVYRLSDANIDMLLYKLIC